MASRGLREQMCTSSVSSGHGHCLRTEQKVVELRRCEPPHLRLIRLYNVEPVSYTLTLISSFTSALANSENGEHNPLSNQNHQFRV